VNDQPVTVVLDLVDPFRAVRNLGATGRNAGFEWGLESQMAWKAPKIVELSVGMEINMYMCATRK
jgi:coenzyme PQQ precursor peptide PqqA